MQSNWLGNNKPNCLIIDEIDGITDREGKGAVEILMNIITGQKSKSKKKGNHTGNTRPIICICNNQYAPVLRKLKAVVQVFNFEKPRTQRVVQRLKVYKSLTKRSNSHHLQEISAKENLSIDTHALTALCELTECDIRSSLNTLQVFITCNKIVLMHIIVY